MNIKFTVTIKMVSAFALAVIASFGLRHGIWASEDAWLFRQLLIHAPLTAFFFPYSKVSSGIAMLLTVPLYLYCFAIFGLDRWSIALAIGIAVFFGTAVAHFFSTAQKG
jgi:hypothetical protein